MSSIHKKHRGEVIPQRAAAPHPSQTCLFVLLGGAHVCQTGAKVSHLRAGLLAHFVRKQAGLTRRRGEERGSAFAWKHRPPQIQQVERGFVCFSMYII